MLFTTKPTALGELAAVVVDECPWQSALEGVTGRGDRMPLDALRGEDRQFQDDRSPDWHALQHHRVRALAAVESHSGRRSDARGDGSPRPDSPGRGRGAGAGAGAACGSRISTPACLGPSGRRCSRPPPTTSAVMQAARFWRAAEALLAEGGPSRFGLAASRGGRDAGRASPDRAATRLQARSHRVAGAHACLSTRCLNPGPRAPALAAGGQMTADVQVETPHQRVRQAIDRAYAKSRLEPLDDERAS